MTEPRPQVPANRVYWAGVAACAVSAYTLALQNSAMNVAGPVLARDFAVDVSDASAVTLVYTIPIAATLIAGGRMGDVFGARKMFRFGVGLYLVTSAMAGLAPGLGPLLLVRVLQSVGATLVVSNQLGLAARSVGALRRGEVFGILNLMAYAGQVSGPVVGGLLTAGFGWRSLFWMNVPLALGLLVWGIAHIPSDTPSGRARALDLPGAALFAGAVAAILFAINRSPAWGPTSPQVLGLVAVSIVFGIAFVYRETRTAVPMLDLTLFRRGNFSAAVGSSIANFVANSGVVLLLPFYLVEGQNLGVEQAGMALVPLSLLMAMTAPMSGRLGDRVGPRIPSIVGMLLLSLSVGAIALFPFFVPVPGLLVILAVAGVGIGLFTSANTTVIMGTVPQDRLGVAGGIVHTARYIGLTAGVALAGAVYVLVAQADAVPTGSLLAYRVAFAVLAVIAGAGAVMLALARSAPRVDESVAARAGVAQ